MKVLIVDDNRKNRGFSDNLKQHNKVTIQNDNFQNLDFTNCKIIFEHDTFSYDLSNEIKEKVIHVKFSGGGTLNNEILNESDGYKFKAKIESPEQINNVISIIDKVEYSKEDLEMILNHDSKLEKLLEQVATKLPLEVYWTDELRKQKTALQKVVTEKLSK